MKPKVPEPTDPQLKEGWEQLRREATLRAVKCLEETIPQKIVYLNTLVPVTGEIGSLLHLTDMPPSRVEGRDHLNNCGKRVKLDDENVVFTHEVAANEAVLRKSETSRDEALHLIEVISSIKLWIQLNVPRIEDGNNFGVAIQEGAIQELQRSEETAFSVMESITKYHMTRAKIASKVIKYPMIHDYRRCLEQLDANEWINQKTILVELRNSYASLFDMLRKNWEKVAKPREKSGFGLIM
ncbi:MAG: hypothetical protein KVP17_003546 [Porospora cf. gigantea B]|uniref:uncharacterized protein n=1 Tax=Porospora cf. gigantea B TaxID=2853592 RepID=UPI003571F68E|nr:MAG: hypothetical protein KVP17_003546 [Porospora cf. gigantea B]